MAKLYAAKGKYGPLDSIKFYFHARNQADADAKIAGWNRYHGFSDSPGYGWHEAVVAEGDVPESWIHDEWLV